MPSSDQKWETYQKRVSQLLQPHLGKIAYGNVRAEDSDWNSDNQVMHNLAVVYEIPGGSTSQINVSFTNPDGEFTYINPDNHSEHSTQDPAEVLAMMETAIKQIPEKRRQCLRQEIERWFGKGRTSGEMFTEINKLLHLDFKGGTITHQELKDSINYIIELGKLHPQESQ